MKKKFLGLVVAGILAAGVLTGCGGTDAGSANNTEAATSEEKDEAADTEAASDDTADSADKVTIKIAASPTPHAEILQQAKTILADKGYDLEITEFEDYVQPNEVVEAGEYDANYFQHIPYLESFNEEKGTHLVNAGGIHYEPFGIYPGTKSSLDDIADGDSIAVPNDTTNEARALLLLQQEGLIKLKDGIDVTATVNDVAENPKNIKLVEVEAAQVPKQLPSVAFGVINGNYALEAGLKVETDALALEKADGAAIQQYVNIIAVKDGNESSDKIKALTKALHDKSIVDYINNTYKGAVVPYEGK
jgi:D-methionine transport system substrate-binding protein